MSDATSLLYDLEGFAVVSVAEADEGPRRVVIMQIASEHACPRCGVIAGSRPYDVRESRVKDLPMGHRRVQVIWRKRRYRCRETACAQRVFVERSVQIPPRYRLTGRLRARLESAASVSARALSDVATELWGVVVVGAAGPGVVAAAARTPTQLPAVRRLGLDETRARSLRWAFDPDIGKWRWSDDQNRGSGHWPAGVAARADRRAAPGPRSPPGSAPGIRNGGTGSRWWPGPLSAVRRDDPAGAAPGHHRGGPLPSGAPSESGAHRGPAAGRPRAARSARPQSGSSQ